MKHSGIKWQPETLVSKAEEVAKELGKGLDTQLRKIFDAFRKCERDFKRDGFDKAKIAFLKPKLAYAVSREGRLGPVTSILLSYIEQVEKEEDFEFVLRFLEAVVAYYKFYNK